MIYLDHLKRCSILLVLLSLLIVSCGSREGQLTGEVFVVTKGGQNFRLALVEVRAIPEDVIMPFIETKKTTAKTELAKLRPILDQAQASLRDSEASLAGSRTVYGGQLLVRDDMPSLGDEAFKEKLEEWSRLRALTFRTLRELSKEIQEKEQDLAQRTKDLTAISDKINCWKSAECYFEGLPTTTTTAKTDADGKFTLSLDKKKRFVIAARATREIPSATEKYFWLIWVSLDGKSTKRIMLSNDNLLGIQNPDAVVRIEE
jgi:hypothetical protein